MARNGNNHDTKANAWNTGLQFANHSWTVEDDKNFDAWLKAEAPDLSELLKFMVQSGYKLSFGWDELSEACRATFSCFADKHVHYNWGFSGWSDDAEESILVAAYKALVIYRDTKPNTHVATKSGRR